MPFAITCTIAPDSITTLKALRLSHLEYIGDHKDQILFGGPARGADGVPREMIIIVRTSLREEAQAFIDAEPYNASGKVFSAVEVRSWTQIVPELESGALQLAITEERHTHSTQVS